MKRILLYTTGVCLCVSLLHVEKKQQITWFKNLLFVKNSLECVYKRLIITSFIRNIIVIVLCCYLTKYFL